MVSLQELGEFGGDGDDAVGVWGELALVGAVGRQPRSGIRARPQTR